MHGNQFYVELWKLEGSNKEQHFSQRRKKSMTEKQKRRPEKGKERADKKERRKWSRLLLQPTV